jgi:hypothetical protein
MKKSRAGMVKVRAIAVRRDGCAHGLGSHPLASRVTVGQRTNHRSPD